MLLCLPSWTIRCVHPSKTFGRQVASRQNGGLSGASSGTVSRPPRLKRPAKRRAIEPGGPADRQEGAAGSAVQGRLQTVVCQQLPIL